MYVHHTIIRRLFLLYAQSLRSIACFAGLFLRRQRRPSLYSFFYNDTIHLTDYRLVVYRRAEIGDITTVDSYYEGSGGGKERAQRATLIIHPPSIFTYGPPTEGGALACFILRTHFLPLWFFMFERFIMDRIHYVWDIYYGLILDVLRDLSRIDLRCSERFITDWFTMFWEIYYGSDSLCLRDLLRFDLRCSERFITD